MSPGNRNSVTAAVWSERPDIPRTWSFLVKGRCPLKLMGWGMVVAKVVAFFAVRFDMCVSALVGFALVLVHPFVGGVVCGIAMVFAYTQRQGV